ncbi:MAG: methyltransferase domain-containing protein [Bdellovibrionaceae bacterium]|nr:methyltransferase domain-containing protein [Bdellovibrionales bacterium]MCB9086271.1 methyltransferase domain-containing protein [Pseudobdellovibrionaceae bacterium]
MSQDKFIQIDEEGYLLADGVRVTDPEYGHLLLSNLVREEKGRFQTSVQNHTVWVEAFDEPLVALQIDKKEGQDWELLFPYGFRAAFGFDSLSLDEWDRFHGLTRAGIPFVLSRAAQAEFFNLLEDYDDETIVVNGNRLEIPTWLIAEPEANKEAFWTGKYNENFMPWDLEEPSPALVDALAQLKIPKSRILVPGCGTGNDAAYLAKQGHLVTAFDISPNAIEIAKQRYGQIQQLEFLQADVFQLPDSYTSSFDIVFEHTCYCAVNPTRRNELMRVWKRVLIDGGHLLGVFFTMDRRSGPPFGGSEWEIRQRLKKDFDFLYWTRWRRSVPGRQGAEMILYARKL